MPSRKSRSARRSRKSRGSRRSRTLLPHPERGAMGDYSTTLPTQKRHSILRGLVRKNGYATTIRDISLRATLNKHHKTAREKMLKDMHWLQAEHK